MQAGEHLKVKKTHEREKADTCHLLLSIMHTMYMYIGGHFDTDAASGHKISFDVTLEVWRITNELEEL